MNPLTLRRKEVAFFDAHPGVAFDEGTNREIIGKMRVAVKSSPQVDVPITDHFAEGLYGREIFVPKGTVTIARIHKQSQLQIMLTGSMSVFTEKGLVKIVAPRIWVAPAGEEKATLYNEDTRRITILGTDLKDAKLIFDTYTADTPSDILLKCEGETP